ncbi:MAG: hypothetical protein V4757_16145 [Pseudomonadota bacterium]
MVTQRATRCAVRLLLAALLPALAACGTGKPMPAPATAVSAAEAPAAAAIEAAAQAFAQENLQPLQAMLPARFIGRASVLDAAARTLAVQKKIELRLSDFSVQPSPPPGGPVAVTARWEKRFLKLPGLTPTVESGMLAAVLVRSEGRWVFDSLNADNPFMR